MNRKILTFSNIKKGSPSFSVFVFNTMLVSGFVETAQAEWTQWPTGSGGNGHYYQVVAVGTAISWDTAQANAATACGYLATITNEGENTFVFSLADAVPGAWGSPALDEFGPWLGGFQPPGEPEPSGGWAWLSGEVFAYTNWDTGEPNNAGGVENKLHFHAKWAPGTWNDLQTSGVGLIFGYVIERESSPGVICSTVPTVSEWGMMAMAALMLSAGGVVIARRRAA